MSIFGKIMGAIFGPKAEAAPAGVPVGAPTESGGVATATPAPAQPIDVVPILEQAAAAKGRS